jgi:hypothetical protein
MGFMQFLQANFPQGGRIPQSQALTLYRDYLSAQYDAQSTGGSSGGLTPWQLYTLGRHGKLDARQAQQRQEDLNWRRTTHQYRVNQDTQGNQRAETALDLNRQRTNEAVAFGEHRRGRDNRRDEYDANRDYMQSLEDERNALSRRLSSPAMITQPEEQARLTARVNALDTQIAQERERMRGNVADTTVTNRTTAPSAPASPPIDPNDPNAAAWDLPDAGAPKVVRAIVTLKDGTRHIAEGTEEDLNREYPGWERAD